MATVTKKELVDRIATRNKTSRLVVRRTVQAFLDEIIRELEAGNRLEFRDFGVFEARHRAPRVGQNPATLAPVMVPARRRVRFKPGRMFKQRLAAAEKRASPSAEGGTTSVASPSGPSPEGHPASDVGQPPIDNI